MKKEILSCFIIFVIPICIACVAGFIKRGWNERTYDRAVLMYESGNYDMALYGFDSVNGFRDAYDYEIMCHEKIGDGTWVICPKCKIPVKISD